ncbi:hypothetical protein SISSUDRAFT_932339 [Sistotremastrum suecicum HHB10207 ss-3]|uniref:F-box domain-containing protein n=1 Tax=Sistotremastrum suecicum HHB10207 ss-3 TaxID=1314776 RepID=A0A166BRG0_9AGAM|nr:hypothetical protein SISSUDRAFT_932339 [Sistotremastrum suecicum HHB10207 ss-3]
MQNNGVLAQAMFPAVHTFRTGLLFDESNPLHQNILKSPLVDLKIASAGCTQAVFRSIRTSDFVSGLTKLDFADTSQNLVSSSYNELKELVPKLTSLRDLTIPSAWLPPAIFRRLSEIPALEILEINTSNQGTHLSDFGYQFYFPVNGFLTLKSLAMPPYSPDARSLLSPRSKNQCLEDLTLDFKYVAFADAPDCLRQISNSFINLTTLYIRAWMRLANDTLWGSPTAFSILEPLLSLTKISGFTFVNEWPLPLSDSEIGQIAQAWPELEDFDFCPHIMYSKKQTIATSTCLGSFARYCPRLRTLSLAINVQPLSDKSECSIKNIAFSDRFSRLDVAGSVFPSSDLTNSSSLTPLAVSIANLLPNGASFQFLPDEDDDTRRSLNWKKLADLVNGILQERLKGIRDPQEGVANVVAKQVDELEQLLSQLEIHRPSHNSTMESVLCELGASDVDVDMTVADSAA